MTNLTITIDEQKLKRARIRALEEGTSVNAVLRDYLESYAGVRRERRRSREYLSPRGSQPPLYGDLLPVPEQRDDHGAVGRIFVFFHDQEIAIAYMRPDHEPPHYS